MSYKVKCIDASECRGFLEEGKIYPSDLHPRNEFINIYIEGRHRTFYGNRFVEVKDAKVVGYKLLKELPGVRAGHVFSWNEDTKTWNSKSATDESYFYYQNQIDTNPDWFEPVYEEENKKSTIFVGNLDIPVYIERGKISIMVPDRSDNIEIAKSDIDNLMSEIMKLSLKGIGPYNIQINKLSRFFQIGCDFIGATFSYSDLEKVIKEYNEVNK